MRFRALILASAGACVFFVVAAQEAPAKRSVWDGVYTEAQARRGERQYTEACVQCHGDDLAGNAVHEIPMLVLDPFMTSWNGKTAKDLFDTVKQSMPKDKPGSLNSNAYVDIVAYLLQANKFPSGSRELYATPAQLQSVVIERAKAR